MFQYDSRFADAFWNSSRESLLRHLLNIMTSWALVVDVWYLPPQHRQVRHSFTYLLAATHTTVLRPSFRDHPGELVPEENFWTSWCKGRLAEADTATVRLGANPSGLTSAHLHHPPCFFAGRMPFLPSSQQCQSTEGQRMHKYSMPEGQSSG